MNTASFITKTILKIEQCSQRFTHNLPWNCHKKIQLDTEYLCDAKNAREIQENIQKRKGVGDIALVNSLKSQLEKMRIKDKTYTDLQDKFYAELLKIPNKTHPTVSKYKGDPVLMGTVGQKKTFSQEPREFGEIAKYLKLIRTEQLGAVSGSKSYFLLGELAQLEQALVRYIVGYLLQNDFKLMTVPDIVHRDMVEACGMNTRGTRNQVYTLEPSLHGPDMCLSGTSEIALAGYLSNKSLSSQDLPLKLAAVSRCYRAETSNVAEERGIYRVHEFTKVEMFVASTPETSDERLEEIRKLQQHIFESLGLHFRVLDMPPHELGAQAYRKYDMEAWLYGRKMFGEISSCSNCLDYQSRRLNVRYKTEKNTSEFVHTLNGTACAIPRLLIALVESGQNPQDGSVDIPEVLQKYMRGKTSIKKQKRIPELSLIKNKK